MNLSRFFGSTNREALRQVRLALGPDALIVSNRRVNGGVEILATDATSAGVAADAPPQAAELSRPAAGGMQAAQGGDVMGAIDAMRGALEHRIDELLWGNQLRKAPQAVHLFQSLLACGFSTALLRAMLKCLPPELGAKAALEWARSELVSHLPVRTDEDQFWQPGMALALVGPTGVGKTTTLAKLAARVVRRYGPSRLVLLTTDTYRIGAHEQLLQYGRIMQVPVHVVQDVQELQRIVSGLSPEQLVLIDNVGISQRDAYLTEQAAMLAQAGRPVQRLLVLNAASHGDTLDEVARRYANDGGTALAGCILTKLDEASRLGPALDIAIRYQLRIHFISHGQKVPEHLQSVGAEALVDQALQLRASSQPLFAPTEADLAALLSMARPPEADHAAEDARRRRLLPGLLSLGGQECLTDAALTRVREGIEAEPSLDEAYELWRLVSGMGADQAPDAGQHRQLMLRGLAQALSGTALIAVHDGVAVGDAGAGARLSSVMLHTPEQGGLISPLQQWRLPGGWQSSSGTTSLHPLPGAAALADRWQALHGQLEPLLDVPIAQVFAASAVPGWRAWVQAAGGNWLAVLNATARLPMHDGATTAAALARTLHYQPASALAAGSAWLGSTDLELAWRGQPPLLCTFFALRSGGPTGVHGMPSGESWALAPRGMSASTAAAGLLAWQQARSAQRQVAGAWRWLGTRPLASDAALRALAAAQFGMAATQLGQRPGLRPLYLQASEIAGRPEGLSSAALLPALLRLFALKAMLD